MVNYRQRGAQVLMVITRVALANIASTKRFIVAKVEQQEGEETAELWQERLHHLNLSPTQQQAVLQLRRLYLERQSQLQVLPALWQAAECIWCVV